MANVEGKAYAINIVTPISPWKTPFLRLFFGLIAAALWFVKILGGPDKLGRLAGLPLIKTQVHLHQLSFIYFARWVIVPRGSFPRVVEAQPSEALHYDYVIFCSNFTGTWDAYIDAFSEVIPEGIDGIWGFSVNYKPTHPVTPFKNHIRDNQVDTDYYYSAYPGASTTDIRLALDLEAKLEAFAASSQGLAPVEFDRAYSAFLTSVQNDLSSTGLDDRVQTVVSGGEPVLWSGGGRTHVEHLG
jgi:hypothetical protein